MKGDQLEASLEKLENLDGLCYQIGELTAFKEIGLINGKSEEFLLLRVLCLNFEDVCAIECESNLKLFVFVRDGPLR